MGKGEGIMEFIVAFLNKNQFKVILKGLFSMRIALSFCSAPPCVRKVLVEIGEVEIGHVAV